MEPFASLAGAVRSSVPRVLINRDLVGPFAWQQRYNDVAQLGDVVSGVEKLVELLDWTEELQTLIQKEKEKVGRGSEPHLPPLSLFVPCAGVVLGGAGLCSPGFRLAPQALPRLRSGKRTSEGASLSAISQGRRCRAERCDTERFSGTEGEDADLPTPDETEARGKGRALG